MFHGRWPVALGPGELYPADHAILIDVVSPYLGRYCITALLREEVQQLLFVQFSVAIGIDESKEIVPSPLSRRNVDHNLSVLVVGNVHNFNIELKSGAGRNGRWRTPLAVCLTWRDGEPGLGPQTEAEEAQIPPLDQFAHPHLGFEGLGFITVLGGTRSSCSRS